MKKFNSIRASVPKGRMVRGYEIKRMPLGAYLEALDLMQNAPTEILAAIFPEKGLPETLAMLSKAKSDDILALFGRCLATVPKQAFALVSRLTGIPEERLMNDEAIGLDGLLEIMQAFLEVNRIENFLQGVAPLVEKIRQAYRGQTPGFSG